jgi:hypothetical protein
MFLFLRTDFINELLTQDTSVAFCKYRLIGPLSGWLIGNLRFANSAAVEGDEECEILGASPGPDSVGYWRFRRLGR